MNANTESRAEKPMVNGSPDKTSRKIKRKKIGTFALLESPLRSAKLLIEKFVFK
jgi:hypothetical protein